MLRLRPKWAEVGRTADLVIAPDNLSVGLTVLPPDAISGVVSALGVEGVTHVEFNAYPGPAGISRYFYPAGVVAPAPGWPAALLDLDTVTATTRLTLRMAPPGVQGANIAWTDICNWGLDGGGRGYLDLASHGSYLNNQVVVRHPGGEVLRAETPSGTDSHLGFSNIDRHWEIGLQGFASPGQFWIYDRTRNALCIAIATNGDCYNNTGSWQSLSDPRVKPDISEYTSGLDQILALQPIAYRYNGRGGMPADSPEVTRYGLDAAATRAVMPELVGRRAYQPSRDDAPTQLLTIDSGPLIYALVNAVKELAASHTALAARVAALGG
jgi:hypothetical protein